jgi:hypothetical protein
VIGSYYVAEASLNRTSDSLASASQVLRLDMSHHSGFKFYIFTWSERVISYEQSLLTLGKAFPLSLDHSTL